MCSSSLEELQEVLVAPGPRKSVFGWLLANQPSSRLAVTFLDYFDSFESLGTLHSPFWNAQKNYARLSGTKRKVRYSNTDHEGY